MSTRPEGTDDRTSSGAAGSLSGQPPEEIERRIEDTRRRLSDTLGALESKLSPRERLRSVADSARRTGERLAHRGLDTISPDITTMIRVDHSHVLALFRRFNRSHSARRREAIVTNACLALEIHATLEEEIFYPTLKEAGGRSEALAKSVAEHDEMKTLIRTIRAMTPGDMGYDETFCSLMRVVLHHVADEESVVLPEAEQLIPDRLAELGMTMTRRRMELLRPHLGEVARTTMMSFPVATAAAAAGLLAIGWMALRPSRRSDH
jgi:hemerythrin superfamily protein